MLGKIGASLHNKLQKVKWGEYRIGDLFDKIEVKRLKYKVSELPKTPIDNFVLPALTAGIQNQGLNNYVPKKNATILKNVISIASNGDAGATFYQKNEFTILQDAYAIKWKYNDNLLDDNNYLFLTNSISKSIYNKYDWTNKAGWNKVKEEKIQLPTKNGKIDFKFMTSFIAELEAEHIAELEAYLLLTGLKDYVLTDKEKMILNDFIKGNLQKVKWGKYRIGDLFEMEKTLSFNKEKLVIGTQYDYITKTSQNQGILQETGFVNKKNINPAGNWSCGLLQMDFFYREKPWYAGQFVRKVNPKIQINKKSTLYFTTIFNKLKKKLLSVSVKNVDKTFLNTEVNLPINKYGEIDFKFIEFFISAIQKLIIKEVVLYTDRKITAAKYIVNKDNNPK